MPFLAKLVFPGFEAAQFNNLIAMARLLLLSPILLGLSNIFAAITQSYRRFFIYSLSPIVYNLGIICGAAFLAPFFGIYGVVYGVIIGAFFHAAIQLPFILSQGVLPRPVLHIFTKTVKKTIGLSIPRTIALGSSHIAMIVLVAFASTFAAGSIAIFTFAFNLQSVPLSIIGVSYSLAAFPTLAKAFSAGDRKRFLEHLSAAMRHIIFWSLPLTALFIVLRAHIVRVILGSGQFNWSDTRLTAAALALFALSVVFQSLVLLFARGMYAMGRTVAPLIANVGGAVMIIVCAFGFTSLYDRFPVISHFLSTLLRVNDLSGTSVLMLPLAFSVGSIVNCIVLWFLFEREFNSLFALVRRTSMEALAASVLAGVVSYFVLNVTDHLFDLNSFFGISTHGFLAGLAGFTVWIIFLKLLRSKSFKLSRNGEASVVIRQCER